MVKVQDEKRFSHSLLYVWLEATWNIPQGRLRIKFRGEKTFSFMFEHREPMEFAVEGTPRAMDGSF